ncbi:hypothetical protein QKU48_gp1006 [Fadolivirus algeromassiliense]|jgi:hypothetical protein|uniref:Uncharacterized protein n=1 Tax=Fadolivirus FV1/VV64 TaxID=3070911 RepID=A0A7D3QVN3_9VIRU|nr:hypothetical protein QKU48_gp1006 [Fadolivirus algeromassiliense]QKF94464.1 hypothetical protein Fadolivirus_1_1006 [Fadolivirus FV1/VV64]
MLNIIVASTNFYGIYGVYTYYNNNQYIESFIIFCAIWFSILYHLVEKNKHNMPGIGIFTDNTSQMYLLNLDRISAICASIVTVKQIYINCIPITSLLIIGMIGVVGELVPEIVSGLYSSGKHNSLIPEYIVTYTNPQKYKINKHIEHMIYVIGHCIWHLSMFHISNCVSEF